jgi:hypothetical protein
VGPGGRPAAGALPLRHLALRRRSPDVRRELPRGNVRARSHGFTGPRSSRGAPLRPAARRRRRRRRARDRRARKGRLAAVDLRIRPPRRAGLRLRLRGRSQSAAHLVAPSGGPQNAARPLLAEPRRELPPGMGPDRHSHRGGVHGREGGVGVGPYRPTRRRPARPAPPGRLAVEVGLLPAAGSLAGRHPG